MTYPTVPLGNQWAHPALATDSSTGPGLESMYANVTVPLNALAADIGGLPGNLTHLRVGLRTAATSVSASSPVPFDTVVTDSASGWNAGTFQYTIPGTGGLYLLEADCTPSSATAFAVALTGLPATPYGQTSLIGGLSGGAAARGCYIPPTPIRFIGGEVVYLNSLNTWTAEGSLSGTVETTWLSIEQIGR